MDFLEKLLDKENFNLHKEVNGSVLLVRKWTDCVRRTNSSYAKRPTVNVEKKMSRDQGGSMDYYRDTRNTV